MARALHGTQIDVDSKSGICINPFDGNINDSDFISTKSEWAQSFCATVMGGSLDPIEKSAVDRSIHLMFNDYQNKMTDKTNPKKVEKPTLLDFQKFLKKQQGVESLASSLDLYTTGSYNMFSKQSNVEINNRFTVYNIKNMGKTFKPIGLLVTLESIWDRIMKNFSKGKRTWIWIDEIYLLFKNEYSAEFIYELFKRIRKFGGIITGITQNVEDLLKSDTARTMLSNSEFILMFAQATSDAEELAELLRISSEQLSYVFNAPKGAGLLYNGKYIIPFEDEFSKNTKMYEMMTSDFDERSKLNQQMTIT